MVLFAIISDYPVAAARCRSGIHAFREPWTLRGPGPERNAGHQTIRPVPDGHYLRGS